ncbi:MAG: hypothetical protein ABR964_01250 [Tepidisphaeraceae bacterium]|jgi:hypothetical protein
MKWMKRMVLAVVLVVVIAIAVAYFSLNSVIRATVQRQGSASLGVPTTLDSAAMSLLGGKLSLNGLNVGSPPNFSAPQMFTVGTASVQVHYGQLLGHPIRINKIVIDAPKLVVEQSNLKLNIQALMDQKTKAAESPAAGGAEKPAEPMKLIIDELDVNNAQVSFMPGLPGLTTATTVPVPSLVLKNIGNADNAQNGAAVGDVVLQTVTALAGQAGQSGNLPAQLKGALSSGLQGVAQQLGQSFASQFQSVTGSLGQNLGQGLGNLGNNAGKPLGQQLNDLTNPGNSKNK